MGNKLSAKKRKSSTRSIMTATNVTTNAEIDSNRNGIWSWDKNGKWINFETATSKQIDNSLRIQLINTSANPLVFPITAGTWFSKSINRNIYSVYVYLDGTRNKINNIYQQNKNTNFRRQLRRTPPFEMENNINNVSNSSQLINNDIYNNLLTMGFDQTDAYQAAMNCTNVGNAIEFMSALSDLSSNYSKNTKTDMIDDFNAVMDDDFEELALGMDISKFQFVDTKTQCLVFGFIRVTFSNYNIPNCINKICSIFYFERNKIELAVGKEMDGRDRWGKWYLAVIQCHKQKAEKMSKSMKKKYKLRHEQEKQLEEKLEKLEAVYLHYTAWEEKWDEWIFIDDNTICTCNGPCYVDKAKHRLSAPNTQSTRTMKNRKKKFKSQIGSEIKGEPIAPGCTGLVNLGGTSFMNSIIQCMSHTPEFLPYILTRKYELDVNSSNNRIGMKGKFVRQFGRLIIDIWSNNYKVVKPTSFRKSVAQYAPHFNGSKFHNAEKFLNFLLNSLNEELNAVKVTPYNESLTPAELSDEQLAELSWNKHLAKNKSKIVDLFHGQCKSFTRCDECKKESIMFEPYSYLSLPLPTKNEKSFIVDVFHRKQTDDRKPNKPLRHVYHVTKTDTVNQLAQLVGIDYEIKPHFILFYENWNMKVAQPYKHEMLLGDISNREAIACYILKDWNKEFTQQEIKNKQLSLCFAKVCHSEPLIYRVSPIRKQPLFGMPFIVSFLQHHTRKQINKIIYERLHLWLGSDILMQPPTLIKLLEVKIKNDKQSEEEIVRPSTQEWNQYELEWDRILNNLPFTLRWMPYASFDLKKEVPESIPCDGIVFTELLMSGLTSIPVVNANINILIEWKPEYYDRVKSILNKVVVDKKYSQWKKSMIAGDDPNALTIYDCMNAYVRDGDFVNCKQCKKQQAGKTIMDIWSFPEILVIHLDRFAELKAKVEEAVLVGQYGRKKFRPEDSYKISNLIECPVVGLDLSEYVINNMDGKPIYDLYATCEHSRHHYTCCAKNSEDNKWYHFNDDVVEEVREKHIIQRATYILFYKKRH